MCQTSFSGTKNCEKNGVYPRHIKVTAFRWPLHRCTMLLPLTVCHIFLRLVEASHIQELGTTDPWGWSHKILEGKDLVMSSS